MSRLLTDEDAAIIAAQPSDIINAMVEGDARDYIRFHMLYVNLRAFLKYKVCRWQDAVNMVEDRRCLLAGLPLPPPRKNLDELLVAELGKNG